MPDDPSQDQMPDGPGAGTPGGQPPVAAGSPPGASAQPQGGAPSPGVLPPMGGAVPQGVKAAGKEARAIDVVRACTLALRQDAVPFITDRDFSHSVMEAILKLEKFVPAPGEHDDQAGGMHKVQQAIAARRAGAGMGGGPAPMPGGRPPGMQQMPPGGGGAPPGMTAPPAG
jgi:hypothetical protein